MDTYQCVENIEKLIHAYGIHVVTKALMDAFKNIGVDATKGIKGFEGTHDHELMLFQALVLEEAYRKINQLRSL